MKRYIVQTSANQKVYGNLEVMSTCVDVYRYRVISIPMCIHGRPQTMRNIFQRTIWCLTQNFCLKGKISEKFHKYSLYMLDENWLAVRTFGFNSIPPEGIQIPNLIFRRKLPQCKVQAIIQSTCRLAEQSCKDSGLCTCKHGFFMTSFCV